MDGDRFDSLTRALGAGRSRRSVVKGLGKGLGAAAAGAVGLAVLGNKADAANGGNSACAQWCHANFSGSAAGHCTSDAAHGTGVCYGCGPAAPAGNGQQLCGGVCVALTTVSNCGSCGNVCSAVNACTPAQCQGGVCNQTSSCTGSQTCGGGGVANQCGCTPATTCSGGQNCGTAPDGCGGVISCGTCTAPANATATCTGGTCGFTCNSGYQSDGKGGCVAVNSCGVCPSFSTPNGDCYWLAAGGYNNTIPNCWYPTDVVLGLSYDQTACEAFNGCASGGCYKWDTKSC